jgi:hypothetical protein
MREEHMSIRLICLTALLAIASLFLVAGADAAPKPQSCGGILPIQCPSGTFCQIPAGKCGADMKGTCTKVPELCAMSKLKKLIVRPVCGCDGKTYGNDCERQMAMVSKKHNGKCKATY